MDPKDKSKMSAEELEVLRLAEEQAVLDKKKKDEDDKDKGVKTVEEMQQLIDAANLRADNILSSNSRVYGDMQKEKETWGTEKQELLDKLSALEGGSEGNAKKKDDEEPDITQDVDAWTAWMRKKMSGELTESMKGEVERIFTDRDKKAESDKLKDDEVGDIAAYLSEYHKDKVDTISREGLTQELQDEINKWKDAADREGIKSITKARKFHDLQNPDKSALTNKILQELRDKQKTLTTNGVSDIAEPKLKGKDLRGASWTDVGERVKKRLASAGDELYDI